MKKILIVGLIMILGLAIFAGCNPKPPETTPPAKPAAPEKPAVETPETPAAGMPAIAGYLKEAKLKYALKEKPEKADVLEKEDLMFPEGVKAVVLEVIKNPDAPKDKVVEVKVFTKEKDEPVVEVQTFKGEDLANGDIFLVLEPAGGFAPGLYRVDMNEQGTSDKISIDFAVGEVKAPEEGKAVPPTGKEPGMAKPMEEKPAEVKEPPTTEKPAGGKPVEEKPAETK